MTSRARRRPTDNEQETNNMDNRKLIRKIEKAAGVIIKASGNKSLHDTRYEAYVSAYQIVDGIRAKRSWKDTSSYMEEERGYAVRIALIKMADKLNVIITDEERTAVERAESANWQARMDLYCPPR